MYSLNAENKVKVFDLFSSESKAWVGNGIAKRHEEAFMFIKKEKVTDFFLFLER